MMTQMEMTLVITLSVMMVNAQRGMAGGGWMESVDEAGGAQTFHQ